MLRKAFTSTSQSAHLNRRHLLPNSRPHRQTAYEARPASSLPFYSPSNNHHFMHIRREDGTNHSNTLNLQPISLLNLYQHTVYSSHQHQGNNNGNNSNTVTTIRQYHTTPTQQRGAAIILTFASVAAAAKAGQYVIQGYNEYKAESQKEELKRREELIAKGIDPDKMEEARFDSSSIEEEKVDSSANEESKKKEEGTNKKEEKRENFFAKFFNLSVGSKYYEGGFEETMTRKEAALILGVRESSTPKRIKEAHRKLLILNHPDTGGSTYMAGKINEAKELLLQGKKM
ncbi:hypothetical protein ACHAWO_009324 [Cyclotella atomus]|uniref:J domain-containing protein n=1 Tax=Cyclotella atomus TaxID=382360 RepID=A0ABD3MR07_9STRA